MMHFIRTTFGDSELIYGGEEIGQWEHYSQGVLQGNVSGPSICTALSSILFDVLHTT